jgi:hypothetical protein
VPSRPGVAVDHRVRRQEPLCLTVRFEPLHLPLSSSRGSMRILSPIVQIPAGPVSYLRHDRSLSNAVAAQAVRDEASWLIAKPTQQMLEEPLGGGAISPLLHQNIQDDTMLIDGAPQVVLHAPDADEHFVEVPGVPWPRPPSLQSSGEFGTELQASEPDTFVGHQDPAFGQNHSTSRKLRLNT